MRGFQALQTCKNITLNIDGQTSRNSVNVNLVSVDAFRLKHNLMTIFILEFNDLVFDRWTISRPNPLNLSAIEWRSMHIVANDPVNPLVGMCDIAANLVFEARGRTE